jgi:hypothetical protein
MSFWKIALLTFVGIIVAVIPLYFMTEADVDDDVIVPVGVVLVLAAISIAVIPLFLKKMRAYVPVLQKMRQEKPVAYFCSFFGDTAPRVITSDEQEIAIWDITKGQPQKTLALPRNEVEVTKGSVQVAAVRSVPGLVLINKANPQQVFPINLCPDKLNIIFSPKKGAELDEAIQRIQSGR